MSMLPNNDVTQELRLQGDIVGGIADGCIFIVMEQSVIQVMAHIMICSDMLISISHFLAHRMNMKQIDVNLKLCP